MLNDGSDLDPVKMGLKGLFLLVEDYIERKAPGAHYVPGVEERFVDFEMTDFLEKRGITPKGHPYSVGNMLKLIGQGLK